MYPMFISKMVEEDITFIRLKVWGGGGDIMVSVPGEYPHPQLPLLSGYFHFRWEIGL
jgi:hypothetical protein